MMKKKILRLHLALDQLKKVVEEFEGNKAAVARHLGYSHKYIRSLCKQIKNSDPEWEHYTYREEMYRKKMPTCFPSNEDRLKYLDCPEMNLTKKFGQIRDNYNWFEDPHKVLLD